MLTQRKRFESYCEVERNRENTGKGVATVYIRSIIERKGDERLKVINHLHKYLNGRFRDESNEFQQDFINHFGSKGEPFSTNTLYELINGKEDRNDRELSREAATLLIVVLAETMIRLEGGKRILRLSEYLLKAMIKMDESGLEFAARGLSFLIQLSKVYAAELVDKCLDQAYEWAHSENTRLASSILLRELALFTSTSFFLRVDSYFSYIFHMMRSPKVRVRLAAASSLHATLSLTSQREAKDKRKWYYTCYEEAFGTFIDNGEILSKDERFHCMLLTLNELLRIADGSIEREYIRAQQSIKVIRKDTVVGSPLEFILAERFMSTVVESRTAARIIEENISTIWERTMETRTSKQPYVISTLLEIIPRFSKWISSLQLGICIETIIALMSKQAESQLSLGLLILFNHSAAKKYIPSILSFVKEVLHNFKKKKNEVSSHSNIFILITLIVRSYGRDVSVEMKEILPLLLNYPLCTGLKTVLHEIYSQNEHWRIEVINGLLHQLSIILMGDSIVGKSISSLKPSQSMKIDTSTDNSDRLELAMRTFGEFNFNHTHLFTLIQCISESYLVCDSVFLRLSSVRCCIAMLRPFIHEYERTTSDNRNLIFTLIQSVLHRLVSVSVVDSDMSVRQCVIHEFSLGDASLLSLLSQPHLLESLRLSLRDESVEMREGTVSLLCKIGMLNPSLVFPRLRRVLLETIGQLINTKDAKMEEHCARLISHMVIQCPKFMRPYLRSVLEALLPKLKKDFRYDESIVHILNTISEVALVGGSEVVESMNELFPLLISFMTDSSSVSRREASLRTICHVSGSTTFAIDVYREYPQLMGILLSLMKTEMSQSTRRMTMRVLGTLGAIDPYTYKSFCQRVVSHCNSSISGLSLPTTNRILDSRQETIELFNYGKCAAEEFYSSITIANLMRMLQNDFYHNNYEEITNDLIVIVRLLPSNSPCISKLTSLLSIVDNKQRSHLDQVFSLIASLYKEDSTYKGTIIRVINSITSSLQSNMGSYTSEVIPFLLDGLKDTDVKIISICVMSIRAMRGSLSSHLHLIIPPMLTIIDDHSMEMSIRKESLDSLYMICEKEDLSDYSPPIIQMWSKAVCMKELEMSSMKLLTLMLSTKWKYLNVFQRSIECSLQSNSIDYPEYKKYLRENEEWIRWKGDSFPLPIEEESGERDSLVGNELDSHSRISRPLLFIPSSHSSSFNHKTTFEVFRRSIGVNRISSKEEWTEWIGKVRQTLIRSSPSPSIRSVSALTEVHSSLAIDLFNAAFLSVWCEMSEEMQNEITDILVEALSSNHSDVVQTILNLFEFMEHSDMGPLLISYQQLGKAAQEVKCYAKALRYKELEVKLEKKGEISLEDAHSLINFSNKLNLQEEAVGVITCVERQNGTISKVMRSRWYEKLNEWEKSLELLNECRIDREKEGLSMEEMDEEEWKCLEMLGKWNELNKKMEFYSGSSHRITVIGAKGKWMSGDWNGMEEYTDKVNENTLDGSFLRAVIAIKRDDYSKAHSYIQKCRDIHDVQLTGMANESYDRAYPAIVLLQELTELEEAIEYGLRPERRGRIALLWSRRLQGCRENVDQWNKLLMIRSLVLSPSEMNPLRIKYSSLCRSLNKMSQCRSQLTQILGLSSESSLYSVSTSHDKPHLVLALSKQLWMDDHKMSAISRLESLSRDFDRRPLSSHSEETRTIIAKTFLKLGEWNESIRSQITASIEGTNYQTEVESRLLNARVDAQSVTSEMILRHTWEDEEKDVAKVIYYYKKATEYDGEWHKGWHRLATAYFNTLNKRKRSEMSSNGEVKHCEYAIEAIRAFTKALQLASGSRLEDTLRLLSLWFEYGEDDHVFEALTHSNKSLPLIMWLEVIPQVMGRLDSSSKSGLLMQQVVLEVAKKYPQSLVYALTVGSKSSNEKRADNSSHVLSLLSKLYPNLVKEAKVVSDELVRCAILWHELWYEALEEASRLYFQEKDIRGMLEVLDPLHRMLDGGPTTLKEHSFYQIFKRIGIQLKTISSLDLNYISPILQKAKELELCVPATFDPSFPYLVPITIYSFSSHLHVITSKQRPRKMSMRGSDGKEYSFLLKGHEDPRQDERVMQFFGLINTLLLHNGDTSRRNVTIERYSITALSQKSGLIGWVPDCDTLHSLIKEYRERKKVDLLMEHKIMTSSTIHLDNLTIPQKIQLFEMSLRTSNGEELADILWLKSPSSEIWFERRTNYTRSMACMSMVGHILGLGDRHPSNVMLDRESGKIVHIDFGDCFEVAQTREKYPEKIPFRLTRMLIMAMEITGIEGNFRLTCERVFQVLRGKKDSLLAVLEAFVYDPLINWRLLDVNKRNPGEKKDTNKVDSNDVNEEVSRKVLDRIKLKLSGREFNMNEVTSIGDQVERLIEQATSHYNLAQSYIGWCPFW
uniref:Serine/threonine-protein kinase TOR n=1 Tax=Pristionchus pacificus TaxID=54126 RepID=A0A2A6CCJ5_PRIPA|eukprot:PDM75955.1 hypothetical protein PRIPAC_43798 [Pristionchus pacificus]